MSISSLPSSCSGVRLGHSHQPRSVITSVQYYKKTEYTYGKIGIVVGGGVFVNVVGGGVAAWITANIDTIRMLIHSDPINEHMHREFNVGKVDVTKVFGQAQVGEEILLIN